MQEKPQRIVKSAGCGCGGKRPTAVRIPRKPRKIKLI